MFFLVIAVNYKKPKNLKDNTSINQNLDIINKVKLYNKTKK